MTMSVVQKQEMALEDDATKDALSQIIRAAKDPAVSVEKVRELYAIAKEMQADAARRSYFAALSRLQPKLPRIPKHGHARVEKEGKFIRDTPFARYEDIDAAIRPLCAEEGFAFTFDSKPGANGLHVFTCEMSHRDGHTETKSLPLSPDQSGGKNAIQAMGSTVTYARRYLLEMHLNLVKVGEDDDANGGSPTITPDQAEELRAQLEALGGDLKKSEANFLKWLKAERYEDILARDLDKARKGIADKRSSKP